MENTDELRRHRKAGAKKGSQHPRPINFPGIFPIFVQGNCPGNVPVIVPVNFPVKFPG